MRHAPFAVTPDAKDRWLLHFRAGLNEVALTPEQDEKFWDYVTHAAQFMHHHTRTVVVTALVAAALVLGVAGSQSWQAGRTAVGPGADPGSLVVSSPYDGLVRLSTREPAGTLPDDQPVETVTVDPTSSGQQWTGVGAALTDASVTHLDGRPDLIRLLFDPASERGARLQWLRLPLS
eukprot:gene3886-4595_t